MRETNVGSELKAAAQDVLHLGARYVQAGRAWLTERRHEMANRNEEYGQQRESATYGRPGSSQDYQQSRGQQGWEPRSQQGQQQRYQQPMGGRDDFETQRYQPQGATGYGADRPGQHYDEFGERAQSWSQEGGDTSSGQQYGAYGQGIQQSSQGSQSFGQQGRQRFGQESQQQYGQRQGQQFGQSGQYGTQQYGQDNQQYDRGSLQYGQGRESLGYGAGERGGRYQGSVHGSGYGGLSQEDRSSQSQFGVGSGLGGMAGGIHGSSWYGTGSNEQRGFRGKGPKNYSRSDERIKEELCERLTNDDDIDASEIEVKVEQGEITLEGKVEQRWMKHRAEDIADGLSGVRNVENKIRVERSDSDLSSGLGKGSAGRGTVSGAKGAAATGSSGSGTTPH